MGASKHVERYYSIYREPRFNDLLDGKGSPKTNRLKSTYFRSLDTLYTK